MVVGILSRALELFPVQLHGFTLLPTGYVALASYPDPEVMAGFHCHLNTNLSKEIGRFLQWQETVFPRRYGATELSIEPEVELRRLRNLLAAPAARNWVQSPRDWPGVSCVDSLLTGKPLCGIWIDRAAFWEAQRRGQKVTLADFTEERTVYFAPLPSMSELVPEARRRLVGELVREIDVEAAARHRADGTAPLGVAGVLALDPQVRPGRRKRRVRPWFYALDPELKEAMRTALLLIMAQYAAASQELKVGNRLARFPLHTFAPTLGFVREIEILEPG